MSYNILVISNMPTPYRIAFWSEFSNINPGTTVLFCSERESNRVWDLEFDKYPFNYIILPGIQYYIEKLDTAISFNFGIFRWLFDKNLDVIVLTGYTNFSYMAALLVSKIRGIPVCLWWGSHSASSQLNIGVISKIKKRILLSFDSYLTYGSLSTKYLLDIGVGRNKIYEGTNSVDNKRYSFASHSGSIDINAERDSVNFLYVGQFTRRKGILELIRAFKDLVSDTDYEKSKLYIVGHGKMHDQITREITNLGMVDKIILLGKFKNAEDAADIYSACDIIVMPSLTEVWGLVINEAMASGMFSMVSKSAGCAPDLILDSPNEIGVLFDPEDSRDFVSKMRYSYDRVRKGYDRRLSQEWIERFTPSAYAYQLDMSIRRAISCRCRK